MVKLLNFSGKIIFSYLLLLRFANGFSNDLIPHHIGVRTIDGDGEFYHVQTGETFVPGGYNYIRLELQNTPLNEPHYGHATFLVGKYDRDKADKHLGKMVQDGFNVVRCFISTECKERCLGNPEGGLNIAFMENVADFLELAEKHQIYVIFTLDVVPQTGGYVEMVYQDHGPLTDGYNLLYLTNGGLAASKLFWQDFVRALIELEAATEFILAYELCNELFFEKNFPPFSLNSGSYKAVNGKTYDLASDADKRNMLEENMIYWVDEIRAGILELDPTALVTVGFFQPQEPHPNRIGDHRIIYTSRLIRESTVDFVDLHAYPGGELTLPQYVDNYGVPDPCAKPLLMGETGTSTSTWSSALPAARKLINWQAESCKYGFDGWLVWIYGAWNIDEFWGGLDEDEAINRLMSPHIHPDPCIAIGELNKALDAPVMVSNEIPDYEKEKANDGLAATDWNAGGFPPQWIEVSLNEPIRLGKIDLLVSQYPEGYTHHKVWIKTQGSSDYELLREFKGETEYSQHLIVTLEEPLQEVKDIKIETLESPSWVGWVEIEVYEWFTLPGIPDLVAPENLVAVATLPQEFSWNAMEESNYYHLQIAEDASFTQRVYDRTTIPETSVNLSFGSDSETLYWRVRGGNIHGFGGWSETRSIKNEIVSTSQAFYGECAPGFKVFDAYPNPFGDYFVLPVYLETPGKINLTIYNIVGEKMVEKDYFFRGAGNHSVKIADALKWKAGLYLYEVEKGGRIVFGKIMKR